MGISAASETSDAQLAESQSPELLTPKNAQTPKGGAKARARGGTGRGTRRRKTSNAPIKDESDVWLLPLLHSLHRLTATGGVIRRVHNGRCQDKVREKGA